MSSTASEEKNDERKTMLIKGTGAPAEEKEAREEEKAASVEITIRCLQTMANQRK